MGKSIGYTYDWEKGRQLSSITGNGLNMSFDYNSSGLRTKKVVGDKTIEYYYSGDLLVAQFDGSCWIKFIYSPSGEAIGFSYYYQEGNYSYYDYCYYVKNVQGDILGFYSMFYSIFREYTYDSWGNITGVYDEDGDPVTNPDDIAYLNPLRYRSYYYDDETGLYYLNSRYYNPEWGTFICADALADTGQSITSTNMYAYCGNNPIVFVDPSGYAFETIFDIISLCISIKQVFDNPKDPWNWFGLVADTVDLLPFATGLGESVRITRKTLVVADNVEDTLSIAKKGWKLGDDITLPTKAGNAPSWSTLRQRYWKNEALFNPQKYPNDLERLKKGLAPIGSDGFSMELHHPKGRDGLNYYIFEPITRSEHRFKHYGFY